MKAVLLERTGVDPVIAEVPTPEPGPGEVRVAVSACGLCGSDLHAVAGDLPLELPLILGHEASGQIDALGEGVEGLPVGERVLINPILTCGHCKACRAGQQNRCAKNKV